MGQMNDLSVELEEAATAIETAAARVTVLTRVLEMDSLAAEVKETTIAMLRDAQADLYDAGIDFTISIRNRYSSAETTVPNRDEEADAEDGRPDEETTRYGARITYPNGDSEDIPNIDAVTVHDRESNTFPFGFVPVSTGDGKDDITEHRASWFDDKGVVHPFEDRESATPYGAW